MREISVLPIVYTEDEVSRHLGVHPETLARERRAGRISYTTVGHEIRYTAKHIEQALAVLEGRSCTVHRAQGVDLPVLPLRELRALPEPTHSECGLYFLWNSDAELIYVGQSEDVKYRVSQHRMNLEYLAAGRPEMVYGRVVFVFERVTWMPVEWPMHLAYEAVYIRYYLPRGNRKGR